MKGVIDVLKMQKETDSQKIKSRRIDYKSYDNIFVVIRFIFECGYKLKCHPYTVAKATAIFHKFFRNVNDPSAYDKYLIAATTLYIAIKEQDESQKLRDIINVTHNTIHRGSAPLDLKDEYWNQRDAIVQAELLVMRVLKFDITLAMPHKFLLHYLKSLQGWILPKVWQTTPLAQSSVAFLQDFHHDSSILDYPPQLVAVACINLALQVYGVQIPFMEESEETGWYRTFSNSFTKEEVWKVMEIIMEVYSKDPVSGEPS